MTPQKRRALAKKEYENGLTPIINKIAKVTRQSKQKVVDICYEGGEGKIYEMWENEIMELASMIEKKYNVWIEHDDSDVRVTAWKENK